MKILLALSTLILSLPAALAADNSRFDSVLVERADCVVLIDARNTKLFSYGAFDEMKLIVPFGANSTIEDKNNKVWSVRMWSPISPASDIDENGEPLTKSTSRGLVVKKRVMEDALIEISLETDRYSAPLRGKNAKLFSNAYTSLVRTTASAGSVAMHSGAFGSEISSHMNCKLIKREVNFSDYQ